MSDNVILIRFGELYLKGKNKCYFENILKDNIRNKLNGIACKLYFGRGRYVVKEYAECDEQLIIERLKQVSDCIRCLWHGDAVTNWTKSQALQFR